MNQLRKILFIRHAESEFNLAMELGAGHAALHDLNAENKQIKFDEKYLDCTITEKGYKQCESARDQVKDRNVKLVIVSPLKRALETCYEIFKTHKNKPKVIVHGKFREMLLSSCDIGSKITESKQHYKEYDFSQMDIYEVPNLWVVDEIDKESTKQKVWSLIRQQYPDKNDQNNLGYKSILELQSKQFPQPFEEQIDSLDRARFEKQYLKQVIQQLGPDEELAVVGHSRNLKTLISKEYDAQGEPINSIFLANCEVKILDESHFDNI